MRIAIVGSRGYPRLDFVRRYVRELPKGTVVISGGARGVDREAEAQRCHLLTKRFEPLWHVFGKSAAAHRNQLIVDDAEQVIAFWDLHSRGTRMTIEMARRAGKPVTIYGPNGEPIGESAEASA